MYILLGIIGLLPFHESPRYLLTSGEKKAAKDILMNIHMINTGPAVALLPLSFDLTDQKTMLEVFEQFIIQCLQRHCYVKQSDFY